MPEQMPTEPGVDRPKNPERHPSPDMRGLGVLSLALAALALVCAVSGVILLAGLAGAAAMPLGLVARGHEQSRTLGTMAVAGASVVLVILAVLIAPAI